MRRTLHFRPGVVHCCGNGVKSVDREKLKAKYPHIYSDTELSAAVRLHRKRIIMWVIFALSAVTVMIGWVLQDQDVFYVSTLLIIAGFLCMPTPLDRQRLARWKSPDAVDKRVLDDRAIMAQLLRKNTAAVTFTLRLLLAWEVTFALLHVHILLLNGAASLWKYEAGLLLLMAAFLPVPLIALAIKAWRERRVTDALRNGHVNVVLCTLDAVDKVVYSERPDAYYLCFYNVPGYGLHQCRVREDVYLRADPGRESYWLIFTDKPGGKPKLRAALPEKEWRKKTQ